MNKFVKPGKTKQVNATVLAPENAGLRIILNLCGQNGKFDKDFDKLLTKRWARVKLDYSEWHATQHNFKLGMLNTNAAVASDIWVVNALVRDKNDKLDDKALDAAVKKVGELCKYENASLHVSNMLVDNVSSLKELLFKHVLENSINVYFYNEPPKE